jgi:antitoxin component YwqK of YwqJK toxin-antitoxin module
MSFKNGIAHGIEFHYYLDGGIFMRMDFENGKRVYQYRTSRE